MKNEKWNYITIETFDPSMVSPWLASTYKSNTWTKFYRLLEEYGSIGGLFVYGPWDWALSPSIGLKAIKLTTHIINDLSGNEIIPIFDSMKQIDDMGIYYLILQTHTISQTTAMMDQDYTKLKKGKRK